MKQLTEVLDWKFNKVLVIIDHSEFVCEYGEIYYRAIIKYN